MRFTIFLLAFTNFSICFAQINPMGYFYRGLEENDIPDFAALAVLDSQHCPKSTIALSKHELLGRIGPVGIGPDYICTSRYRIISVLDAISDTLRKKYLEVKEMPMLPLYMYTPMLIFGKYNNGELRITGHENARNYFGDGSSVKNQGFYPFIDFDDDIDALHSIGAHYYNLKNLDSLDTAYYFEYLIPRAKYKVEAAGKSFDKLLVRLAQNRAPVRVAKIKNGFAALGAIKSLRPASVSKRKNLYELNVTMETVIKNDAKIDSNIAIFIDRGRLPSGWSCQPFEHYLERRVAFYFFGDLKDGSLFIDSLASPQDLFVFGDTIYDISMGLPFEELVAYFFPSNISLEEFKFGEGWKYLFGSFAMQSDRSARDMQSMPVCQKNAIIKTSMKCKDFFDNRQPRAKTVLKWRPPFISNFPLELWYSFTFFRCREPPPADCINCFGLPHTYESCRFSDLKNEGVWGRKW